MLYLKIKRLLDIIFSLSGMIILLPLFLIVSIKLDSKDPVFFKQKRVGINKTYLHGNKVYTELYGAKTA